MQVLPDRRKDFTEQALAGLQESLDFLSDSLSTEKRREIGHAILLKAERLLANPYLGRREVLLEHPGLDHRRLVERHYKIIYRVEDDVIYITDIFDSRRDPEKMRG